MSVVMKYGAKSEDIYSIKLQFMIALFFVLFVSLLVAGFFLGGLLWSVRKDQFEDQQGNSLRMLYDEEADKA